MFNGYGKLFSIDYSIYKGYFLDNKKHGKGELLYPNKYKVIGEWNNNKLV